MASATLAAGAASGLALWYCSGAGSESGRAPTRPPAGLREATPLVAELLRMWGAELLQWRLGALTLGLRHLSRQDATVEVGREVSRAGGARELRGAALVAELRPLLRLLGISRQLARSAHVRPRLRAEHLAAHTGVASDDVLAGSFVDGVLRPAFALIRDDEELRALVLVVRGTHSLRDTLTALTSTSQPHHLLPRGEGGELEAPVLGFAHAGLVAAARWLLGEVEGSLLEALADERNAGFRLYVCGHSLGAGVAVLLTSMMREKGGPLADARCVAFACPACVSAPIAEACGDFVTSVINNADVVPTLSAPTLRGLRAELLDTDSTWYQEWLATSRIGRWYDGGTRRVGDASRRVASGVVQRHRSWLEGSGTYRKVVGGVTRGVGGVARACVGPRVGRGGGGPDPSAPAPGEDDGDDRAAAQGTGSIDDSAPGTPPRGRAVSAGQVPERPPVRDEELLPAGRILHIVRPTPPPQVAVSPPGDPEAVAADAEPAVDAEDIQLGETGATAPVPDDPMELEGWQVFTDVPRTQYTRMRISRTMLADHRQSMMSARLWTALARAHEEELAAAPAPAPRTPH